MVTNIIITSTLFLTLVLFPLVLFISSNFLHKLLQKENQMLEYKIKRAREANTQKKKLQFNLFHLLLRFHKSIPSATQIPILIKIFLAKHESEKKLDSTIPQKETCNPYPTFARTRDLLPLSSNEKVRELRTHNSNQH